MSDPFNFGAPPGQPPQGPGQQQNPLAGVDQQQADQQQAGRQQGGPQNGQNQGSQHGAEHSAGTQHQGSATSSPFGSGGGDPFAPTGHSTSSDPFARGGQPTATLASASASSSSSGPAPGGTINVAKPPAYLLFAAIALAVVAAVLAGLLAIPGVAIGAWVAAGPIAIGIIALFVIRDTWARSGGVYAAPGWVKPLYYTAIVVCLLCILVPAIRIALWVGRW